jgi:hypothetical protein
MVYAWEGLQSTDFKECKSCLRVFWFCIFKWFQNTVPIPITGKCLKGKLRSVVNWLYVSQCCYHIDSACLVCWEGTDYVLYTRQVSLVRHR